MLKTNLQGGSELNVLSIDPGTTGALAVLDEQGNYVAHLIMPTIKVGSSSRVNGAAIAAFLAEYDILHAFIEKVQAMPGGGQRKMGATSAFTFGHAAGLVEGIVAGAGIPLTLVSPQSWKKHAGLIGTDKDAARSRAVHLFPSLRVLDLKGKGQAVADALLLGLYGLSLNRSGSICEPMVSC
jgi:crossover junction endodeoxyribonuclease RuvC